MLKNPVKAIQEHGQSIWQDDLQRNMLLTDELQRSIERDGIRGVTSNPAIFENAIAGNDDYDEEIRMLAHQGKSNREIYQSLTVSDVQMAADRFRPLYDASGGRHGFVSLEVNPHLAHDIEGTIQEARRLWQLLSRPNVMIKVPATEEGVSCIEQLTDEGLNINVTLLFGLSRYEQVAQAYIRGLESRLERGAPVERIASVASFFLSRIDVLVDGILRNIRRDRMPGGDIAARIYGRVAIAMAKRAYAMYKEIFESPRFDIFRGKGARPQRLLWASTSTKEPEFSDIKYVEALIGPDTVNTLPRDTIAAYRSHGNPQPRLTEGMDEASQVLEELAALHISTDQVAGKLEEEGIEKFIKPYDSLLKTLKTAG